MHWTVGHLLEIGADVDLVVGAWGDGTGPADRVAVALLYRPETKVGPSFMIVDAEGKSAANGILAASGLRRDELIGTPLAGQVFALADAIFEQDDRFF